MGDGFRYEHVRVLMSEGAAQVQMIDLHDNQICVFYKDGTAKYFQLVD